MQPNVPRPQAFVAHQSGGCGPARVTGQQHPARRFSFQPRLARSANIIRLHDPDREKVEGDGLDQHTNSWPQRATSPGELTPHRWEAWRFPSPTTGPSPVRLALGFAIKIYNYEILTVR